MDRDVGKKRMCLVVMLQPQLVLAKIHPWPLAAFVCEERVYEDAGFGEWTEFYDWLRDADSNVLGVRYWLRSDTKFLAEWAKELGYVKTSSSQHHIEIYFSERRDIDQLQSCDQEFLYDGIFKSDDGRLRYRFRNGGVRRGRFTEISQYRSTVGRNTPYGMKLSWMDGRVAHLCVFCKGGDGKVGCHSFSLHASGKLVLCRIIPRVITALTIYILSVAVATVANPGWPKEPVSGKVR